MPVNPNTDTPEMLNYLYSRKKQIIIFSLCAAAIGLVLSLLKPREYKAETAFILKNHLYADRTYLYSKDMRYINYYASEDDIERLISLIDADSVLEKLIANLHLASYYKIDSTDKKEFKLLKRKISKKVKIIRTPEKHAVLSYVDKKPEMAAKIANEYLRLIESTLRQNYNSVRQDVYNSLQLKIKQEDSVVASLTDSLVSLREQYGIYDIINPSRGNLMISNHITKNGRPDFARGMEVIQNVESVKDQAVADRAEHISLANQYATGEKMNDLSLIQMIKVAQPPLSPSDIGIILTTFLCFISGGLFGICYILIRGKVLQRN